MTFLSNITKKIKPKKKAELKKGGDIHRDWLFSLITFFVLIFGAAVFGVYMFIDVENIEVSGNAAEEGASSDVINQELLVETIDFYSAKEERFSDLQNDFKGAPSI